MLLYFPFPQYTLTVSSTINSHISSSLLFPLLPLPHYFPYFPLPALSLLLFPRCIPFIIPFALNPPSFPPILLPFFHYYFSSPLVLFPPPPFHHLTNLVHYANFRSTHPPLFEVFTKLHTFMQIYFIIYSMPKCTYNWASQIIYSSVRIPAYPLL